VAGRTLFAFAAFAALLTAPTALPAQGVVLKANLTGTYLHTTSTGSGTATIMFRGSEVCWKFVYHGLDTPGDSGVHIAPPPAPGKHKTSVFPFTATTSIAPGCVPANHWGRTDAGFAQKIPTDPSRYYVIIATAKYPQGAIGGQLRAA
jgi:CHRD domain.